MIESDRTIAALLRHFSEEIETLIGSATGISDSSFVHAGPKRAERKHSYKWFPCDAYAGPECDSMSARRPSRTIGDAHVCRDRTGAEA